MEDKEVGELWEELCDTPTDTFAFQDEVLALIRKLVEEATQRIHTGRLSGPFHGSYSACPCEREALARYEIDPKTWK